MSEETSVRETYDRLVERINDRGFSVSKAEWFGLELIVECKSVIHKTTFRLVIGGSSIASRRLFDLIFAWMRGVIRRIDAIGAEEEVREWNR